MHGRLLCVAFSLSVCASYYTQVLLEIPFWAKTEPPAWVLCEHLVVCSRWAHVNVGLHLFTLSGKLKADRPPPRNYPQTPTDYRHTDKHLWTGKVKRFTGTDKHTDGFYYFPALRSIKRTVHCPGIEPGSQEWESCMIPLHQQCWHEVAVGKISKNVLAVKDLWPVNCEAHSTKEHR